MRRLVIVAVIALAGCAPSLACADTMSAADIAKLPQNKVEAIKQDCKRDWGDNFSMRLLCEDKQFKALQTYINRDGEGRL